MVYLKITRIHIAFKKDYSKGLSTRELLQVLPSGDSTYSKPSNGRQVV